MTALLESTELVVRGGVRARARLHDLEGVVRRRPTWIVYVKGRTAPLGASNVRDVSRRFGFVDTKVASVSDRFMALRFVRSA